MNMKIKYHFAVKAKKPRLLLSTLYVNHEHLAERRWWLSGKESSCNAGDPGSIPGGGRNGNPLQYSCLENPIDRGAWRVTVHRVAKSQTRLKQLSSISRGTVVKCFKY